jgi:CheY-like chemotaxis protein
MMRQVEILYVEDDPADAEFAQVVLAETEDAKNARLTVVEEGESAVRYLSLTAPYERARRPDLIILDLNLRGMNGRDVLKWIKSTPAVANIPVVIFTTSTAQRDIDECYRAGASLFLSKPLTVAEYRLVFGCLCTLWARLARYPSESPGDRMPQLQSQ